ncbi:MAG: GDSL-type esterase/lipase family protein [Fibrobacteria bacterium]
MGTMVTKGIRMEGKARIVNPLGRAALVWAGVTVSGLGLASAQSYKYDFGPAGATAAAGFTAVNPSQVYSSAAGFGFEKSGVTCESKGTDALTGDFCTGAFMFSVKIPQGNYNLTVHFGDPSGTSETTVEAENRRLLFDRITTASGQLANRTITVNRREAKSIDGSVTMTLKDRELGYRTWDEKLTILITGRKSAVAGLELTKVDNAITWYLCGNSTVVDQLDEGWAAWGQYIPYFLKTGVSIANYAESGLTAPGFLSMKRLTKLLTEAKPGDFVSVEFGHNDQKNSGDVSGYPNNLKTFVTQIKAKGCIPIFVTPTAREGDGNPKTSIGGLAEVMRTQAKALDVAMIDLNAMVIQLMQAYGTANAHKMYMDGTHFTEIGGYELGRCVAKGVKELNNTMTPFLTEGAVFDPAKPDPVDFLTTTLQPVALQPSKLGKALQMEILPATIFPDKQGKPHTADGKRLEAVPERALSR